ncbi:hypothetical protein ACFVVM_05860 [Nocardia sp. NPDC058176]|uniref:hypothetical protein n=1 Tax=Nocardia sp. NPDC058176 TaxID=3346368 RepID=UPI0036DBE3DE
MDGVRPRLRGNRSVLIIGPAYDKLSPAEKQGALAEAVVHVDMQRAGRWKAAMVVLFVVGVPFLTLSYLAGYATGRGILPEIAGWQVGVLSLLAYAAAVITVNAVWARRILYQLDRRMLDVLGAEMVALILDLDERSRIRARGVVGIFVKLVLPSKARRARRLDSDLLAGVA